MAYDSRLLKIALEEHFALPDTLGDSEQYAIAGAWDDLGSKLLDVGERRLAEMDRYGIERSILSLNSPGIQGIHDPDIANETATRANDALAEVIRRHPGRFSAFAALPMQDPDEAAMELTRCIADLGFKGSLINGFTERVGEVLYLDSLEYRDFWAVAENLHAPVYLHPRDPLPSREPIYEGYPWLRGSAWAFGAETAMHALRLMTSGLFDRHPTLTMILGHLGENLPYSAWRIDHRLKKSPRGKPAKKTITECLRSNVYVTTSGNFNTAALQTAIAVMGVERVLFSVDFPFEDTVDAATWFDAAEITEEERQKIGRENAVRLFNL
jgi:gamma-resorcylate decarboxylase